MTISSVIQKGSFLYIYNEKNQTNGSLPLGGGKFCGFSPSCICIQKSSFIHIYDEKGRPTGTIPLGGGEFHSCAATINIKRNGFLYMYDEKGHVKGTRNA